MAISKSKGFTLIELMIVVALVGTLVVTTVPLAKFWISGAQLSTVKGALSQAVWKGKNSAIRNERLTMNQDPVSMVCVNPDSLNVRVRNATNAATCGASPTGDDLWTFDDVQTAAISSNGNSVTCICFDNLGVLTNLAPCGSCLSDSNVLLTIGDNSEAVHIY